MVFEESVLNKLENIARKYKFRATHCISEEGVEDFCKGLRQAWVLGLDVEAKDIRFVNEVYESIIMRG